MSLLVCGVKKSNASLICCVFSPHQTMCVVSRMSAFVVSLKTGAISLTGQGRITWRRIPSDLPIPARRLTAVEPRRVRKQGGDHFMFRFISVISSRGGAMTETYQKIKTKQKWINQICVPDSGWLSIVLLLSGYYMYIEASRPRVPGDRARLLSPLYNVTSVRGPKGSGRVPYCVSFYYHMKGKHIGE